MKPLTPAESRTVARALKVMEKALAYSEPIFTSPDAVRRYLTLRLALEPIEHFVALWLDNGNRLVEMETISRGTTSQTVVYPKELVRSALRTNAAGVILAHNHPSGAADPSPADMHLTRVVKDALALVDVRTLDHFIVAGTKTTSFAERGLL